MDCAFSLENLKLADCVSPLGAATGPQHSNVVRFSGVETERR